MCSNTQSFFEGVNNSLHYPPIREQRKGGRQGGGSGTVGRGVGRTPGNLRAKGGYDADTYFLGG